MERLALIRYPMKHSFSSWIHEDFAQQFDMSVNYEIIELPEDIESIDLRQWHQNFFQNGGKGFNVTAPFKQRVVDAIDILTDAAAFAQSVNTVYCVNQKSVGHNTDGAGLVLAMQQQSVPLLNKPWLILGAGGAAAGIIGPLLQAGAKLYIMNRTEHKAQILVERFNQYGDIALFEGQSEIAGIIQARSEGDLPSALQEIVSKNPGIIAYDLTYLHTGETEFLKFLGSLGVSYRFDGLGMLVWQAALAFECWFGRRPDAPKTFKKLTNLLRGTGKIR